MTAPSTASRAAALVWLARMVAAPAGTVPVQHDFTLCWTSGELAGRTTRLTLFKAAHSPRSQIMKKLLPLIDLLISPVVYLAACLMRFVRKAGVHNMPASKQSLLRAGVFPIIDKYYEPLFNTKALRNPLNSDRVLPGINWNTDEQLQLLDSFNFGEELRDVGDVKSDELTFHLNNGAFESGDAEFLYNIIRLKKPSRIVEIGSGNSTLMAIRALKKNQEDEPDRHCEHICIEPYEMPWLESSGVQVIRQTVETVDKTIFAELNADNILFIDSSHIIRPQGDVLFEYLEIIPTLKVGVIVHIHDIFSPKDYLKEWVVDEIRFWNEQYLLEAFLTCNNEWKIIGALNYLHHHHFDRLQSKCPFLVQSREPGSFYIQRSA